MCPGMNATLVHTPALIQIIDSTTVFDFYGVGIQNLNFASKVVIVFEPSVIWWKFLTVSM